MADKTFQGVRLKNGNTEFCVHSPEAKRMELCLFSNDEKQETRLEMQKDQNGIWHLELDGNLEGQKYGYRSHGEFNPDAKHFFNSNKLLVDPYAVELSRSLHNISNREKEILLGTNDIDSASVAPKGIVRFIDKESLSKRFPYLYKKPNISWGDTHIYELHVGNFSSQHPDIAPENRGKLAAVSHSINYLKALNYNQIELMPITPTVADWHLLQEKGLSDQWGYNPINHHAIDPRYGNIYDLLSLVNDLHANGMEACLDLVYNHTGEFGPKIGFLLSYKGLDAASYYRYSPYDNTSFVNTSGCGNGFNPNSEQSGRIMRDSLMFFSDICGIDAFRFDLAGDCALDNNLHFNPDSNFIKIVKEVSERTGVKVAGEPWSATGGYFLGQMQDIHEWNDKHEKTLRRFIGGEHGQVGALAFYMSGGGVNNKINIFTKHDGATQYDWATYSQKNNYANNENNNDGSNDNHYSPSYNDEQRMVKTKTAHVLNTIARGVPLSLSGDELWRSQSGNNNGYALSFPLQWQNFTPAQRERYIFERKVNAFRQNHPAFCKVENLSDALMPNGKPSWEWVNINGQPMQQSDWNFPYNRFLGYVVNGQNEQGKRIDDDFLVLVSGNPDGEMKVQLPPPPHKGRWELVFDTSKPTSHKDENKYNPHDSYVVQPHACVVMTNRRPQPQATKCNFNLNLKNSGR